jgi:hypothetical protein
MTKYARIISSVAVEVFTPHNGFSLSECFHPDVAATFSAVPDNVTAGSTVDGAGHWTIAPDAPAPAPGPMPMLTPMTLYMAFTPAERIAIKTSADAMVKEFWAMYQLAVQLEKDIDPNLISVQEAMDYLAAPASPGPGGGILASQARIAQILAGIPQ